MLGCNRLGLKAVPLMAERAAEPTEKLRSIKATSESKMTRGIALTFSEMEAVLSSLAKADHAFLKHYISARSTLVAAAKLGLCERKRCGSIRRIRFAFGGLRLCHIVDQYQVFENSKRLRNDPSVGLRREVKALLKSSLPDVSLLVSRTCSEPRLAPMRQPGEPVRSAANDVQINCGGASAADLQVVGLEVSRDKKSDPIYGSLLTLCADTVQNAISAWSRASSG